MKHFQRYRYGHTRPTNSKILPSLGLVVESALECRKSSFSNVAACVNKLSQETAARSSINDHTFRSEVDAGLKIPSFNHFSH